MRLLPGSLILLEFFEIIISTIIFRNLINKLLGDWDL